MFFPFGQFEVLCRTDQKSEWQVQIISALKELYIINNEFPDKNAIAEKIQSLGLDARYAKKSMPFALKAKSDVTAKGQSVFDESTLFSGSHGGVAISAKKSLHLSAPHTIRITSHIRFCFPSYLVANLWFCSHLPTGLSTSFN